MAGEIGPLDDVLSSFHPAVSGWFRDTFQHPSPPQTEGWPAIRNRAHTLIAAPTGSGKTLAAFLCALDDLVREASLAEGALPDEVRTVYVSPLKALSNDIHKNLQVPLAGIQQQLREYKEAAPNIRAEVRTGDTPSSRRTAMIKKPPHILVTTPESLYILLTSEGGRRILKTAKTLILDEIHALAQSKRGSHLTLSIERLDRLVFNEQNRRLVRIGLSATQNPIHEVARFLVGTQNVNELGTPDCVVVDSGHQRALDLHIELPDSPLEPVMALEVWEEIYQRLSTLILEHQTTLIFVNTRRVAERLAKHLSEHIGTEHITSHHGSLSYEHRLDAEKRLKAGQLKALVATASLELGIDIGDVDLVCQIGTTKTIATFLQRVGRSGHSMRSTPKGRIFPLSRDELVESVALMRAIEEGVLDKLEVPKGSLDILAQQIVAASANEAWDENDLWSLAQRAWPYRHLSKEEFDQVIEMLARGFSTRRGRRSAHVHYDAIHGTIRGRRGARLAAITSGGAIPDLADYQVVLEPQAITVGTLNEDFAIESLPGDIFQLGNTSYRIRRVESGKVRVEDAKGQPPTIPFWLGEAPSRSNELSFETSRLKASLSRSMEGRHDKDAFEHEVEALRYVSKDAAQQLSNYLGAAHTSLGGLPTQDKLILERFFDEVGAMHLVFHAPFGSRLNRGLGLALRKRFCQSFNFELQAAANEDAVVLSLGPTHSFPLEDVLRYLNAKTVKEVLTQALLDAPMFMTRWRWNATRALAVLRFRGGKKVAPQIQRMHADDLLTVVFPDQVACLENIVGQREIPDHPLVKQTIDDALTEAMDIDGLESLIKRIENGQIEVLVRDLTEPSPLAAEILNARPYAFLDDAPLEERRTQAILSRGRADPESASDLGALDASAIGRVQEETWPEPQNPDELCDALVLHGLFSPEEGNKAGWDPMFRALVKAGRATTVVTEAQKRFWVAVERSPEIEAVFPDSVFEPSFELPEKLKRPNQTPDVALCELVRGRLECTVPLEAHTLAVFLGLPKNDIDRALSTLEAEGFVFQGRFTPGVKHTEWCERRLLARVHRYTLNRLRKEIEPVSTADFLRFLTAWQHVGQEHRCEGESGLATVLSQLCGYETPAAAWEMDLLGARVRHFQGAWLDHFCLSGRVAWARRSPMARHGTMGPGSLRTTPISIMARAELDAWRFKMAPPDPGSSTADAQAVVGYLTKHGPAFFDDIVRGTGLLRTQLERALAELAAEGRLNSDSYAGLRALLVSHHRRQTPFERPRRGMPSGMQSAGRWSLLAPPDPNVETEGLVWSLLRRWGVVFHAVLQKEGPLPPYRDLLRTLRRLEARGEIRGGRFVEGFTGEQFALPEAIGLLRSIRKSPKTGELVALSAADPLNLQGVLSPGPRIAALAKHRIVLKDGCTVAARNQDGVHWFEELPQDQKRAVEHLVTALPTRARAMARLLG